MPTREQMQLHLDFARPKDSKQPIYYLGPFGSRVSFASQQRRALNVVGSLIELNHIEPGQRIVVVGAGLAGVTATVALSLQGYEPQLYEAGDGIFALQANSLHRYIHPSVNFWPIDAAERTTTLPFLDWYAATAPQVVEALRRQWRGSFQDEARKRDLEEIPALRDLVRKTPIFNRRLKFEAFDRASRVVTLAVEGRAEKVEAEHVLVAVGFGFEANYDDDSQPTYWTPDRLDDIVDGPGGYDILISGTGDGGLIDCLRLSFRNFRAGDFPLEVIAKIETTASEVKTQLIKIEEGIRDHDTPTEIAAYLAGAYKTLLSALPESFEAWLQACLKLDSKGLPHNRVRLVGVFGAPFETGAAAINRFLLAFALDREAVTFVPGSIDRPADQYVVTRDDGAPEDIGDDTLVVIRHGPRHALAGFLEEDEVQAFKTHQMTARAYGAEDHFPPAYFFNKRPRYPFRDTPKPFALTRHFLAFRYLYDRFGVSTELDTTSTEPRFEVVKRVAVPLAEPEILSRLPSTLFGVSVVNLTGRSGKRDTSAAGRRKPQ